MKAFLITEISNLEKDDRPLKLAELRKPEIKENEILIKVKACGICHTEIDEIEGRALPSFFPIIPGHQIVGEVVKIGKKVKKFKIGDRVGAGWIYSACQRCEYCEKGLENLCQEFKATGKDVNGGYCEYFKINEDFAFKLPENFSYEEAAPLFCAGAIGYRSLRLTDMEDKNNLGLIGFGASNHLVLKIAKYLYPNSKIFVFTRTEKERELAKELGAYWAGDIEDEPPEKIHCVIDTTPVWKPPFFIMRHLLPNGRLVINAIRKEEIDKEELLKIDYPRDLWQEKEIKSVSNVTRRDIEEFLKIAEKIKIKPEIEIYPFEKANEALIDIKRRKIKGAKVLKIE
ncbi:MAG: zinc-dependent alcohol dehydrogenase family protein [candidate division WOR-3 bacterium]|nr:zinc-dependent alcohol dehydrogenase family protein [candidate division WOR-3 bacterium]MDW8113850.1 zinc-dependent alcohol dehydrogenase family protein [candidate division WOR-3 bacterium]